MGAKLYKVICRGMTDDFVDTPFGIAYAVADNAEEAYRKVRNSLDARNLGFAKDREMKRIELIAEDEDYPKCGIRLYR